MREILQQRLETLKAEYEKGQSRLREVQLQEAQLHETLLRIGGAIQVVTELLEQESTEVSFKHSEQPPS